jgi:YbbR domain-containing protein
VKVSPETIRVAARNDVLEQMDDLALDRNINLQDLSETTVFQLKVQKPSEDAVLSNETVTVTVEVEPDE